MAIRKIAVPETKKVLVYSRHPVTASGFRALVGTIPGFSVAGCRATADLPSQVAAEKPDLAVIDVNAGIELELLARLRAAAPGTGMILWIDGSSTEFIRQAIDCGVLGILGKDASLDACVRCVQGVAGGRLWLEEELSRTLLCAHTVRLTPREGQLVSLLTQGLRNKEIAWRMKITEGTAKAYLTRLYQKTGASDRFELAVFAMRNLGIEPSGAPPVTAYSAAPLQPQFLPTSLAHLKSLPTWA